MQQVYSGVSHVDPSLQPIESPFEGVSHGQSSVQHTRCCLSNENEKKNVQEEEKMTIEDRDV